MKNKVAKIVFFLFIAIGLIKIAVLDEAKASNKDVKPSKPVIVTEVKEKTLECYKVILTISKTDNADGFEIYQKKKGDDSFKKLGTLKKSGEKSRQYEIEFDKDGVYYIKVHAYNSKGYSKYSEKATIKVALNIPKEKTETKRYDYKDITFKIPVDWNPDEERDCLYVITDSESFELYYGSMSGKELTQSRADKLIKKKLSKEFDSITIKSSKLYEYDKKIKKYYVYSIDMDLIDYYLEYTGRIGMGTSGQIGMMYTEKKYTVPAKGRVTIFEYNGYYYLAVMSIEETEYEKSSFDVYKDIIKSIKPST